MSTFPFPHWFFPSIYPHTNLFWCYSLKIICLFKICQKKYFLKDRGLKIKKKSCPLHTYRCVYVYTALFKALNIHHQIKMLKQDRITNKTPKQNVLQHLDPEELLTWLKEKRIKRSDFQGFCLMILNDYLRSTLVPKWPM